MTPAISLQQACTIVCNAVSDLGSGKGWHVRLRAAQLLLIHLVGVEPRVQRVRAAVYGMSAMHRLGHPLLPRTDADFIRIRDRGGPAMLLLGYDVPHAVLVIEGRVLMELFAWNDHNDPGVLIEPFARDLGDDAGELLTVSDVACGGAAAYELLRGAAVPSLNRLHEQMAMDLARAAAPRVRWQLDSPRAMKERPA